jgi:hypothetical protein
LLEIAKKKIFEDKNDFFSKLADSLFKKEQISWFFLLEKSFFFKFFDAYSGGHLMVF